MGAVFCRKSYGDLGKKQAPIISTATPASNSSCNGPSVAKSCQCDPMWKMPLDLSLRSCELRLCEKERSSEALHSAFHGFSFAFLFGFANGAAQGCQPLPAPASPRKPSMVLLLPYARSIYTNPRQQDTTHPTAILCAQCGKFHTLAEHFFIHPGLTLTTAWIYDDICKD
jgi:hypothetical protein